MIEGKLFPYDSTSNTNFVLYQSQVTTDQLWKIFAPRSSMYVCVWDTFEHSYFCSPNKGSTFQLLTYDHSFYVHFIKQFYVTVDFMFMTIDHPIIVQALLPCCQQVLAPLFLSCPHFIQQFYVLVDFSQLNSQ